ncbi:MAG: proton-conducting membrane transporter [Phycisphaerae bacterium]|nr:proton-conducting membrane transporter [Gemmatimonadaceae bacterium]
MLDTWMHVFLGVAIVAPFVSAVATGTGLVLATRWLPERVVSRVIRVGLAITVLASLGAIATYYGAFGAPVRGEVEFGSWLTVGDYAIPLTLMVDQGALVFSLLASVLTLLVARFSRTYLHKEPGFNRFFFLIGLFAAGTQLVAFAGALDLFFAGWELIGISSALFIGFFHERDEPVRSSVRAFATYRLCDMGLLIAIVTIHETLGSTKLSALDAAGSLPAWESSAIAALLLLSAMGKSAQLPFSGWLPRAMEGPTPSSALFYGAVSIHAGLYLLLRVSSVIEVAPFVAAFGVLVGLTTALYAAAVARIHTDAKGALAHATLAQIGLILAEISLGLTTLALIHLSCHAMLRVYQYLRAPNMIHDAHTYGHGHHQAGPGILTRLAPKLSERVYAAALHRWRLDERIDAVIAPVWAFARFLDQIDRRVRGALSVDGRA